MTILENKSLQKNVFDFLLETCAGFKCDNGRCIPAKFRCDQHLDCGWGDDSDENECGKYIPFRAQNIL